MRILYVEDNQANVYLVRRVALGHEVINHIDGEQAIASIKADNPDLILMDIQLAGPMSGLDVVRKLREEGNETPIIAVTAYAMVGDREKCLAAGCNEYLAKPLPITQLIGLIKKYSELTDLRNTQEAEAIAQAINEVAETEPAPEETESPVDADDIETPVSEVADEALIFDMETEKSTSATSEKNPKTDADVKDDTQPDTKSNGEAEAPASDESSKTDSRDAEESA